MHSALLEARRLPPRSDLKRVFVAAVLERIEAGWQPGEFSSKTGTFVCLPGTERRMRSIEPTDPGGGGPHATLVLPSPGIRGLVKKAEIAGEFDRGSPP
jgi:hypothetical protein